MRGKFITLEGIDGAGKSTHMAWLAGFLQWRGLKVLQTREPGGTALGETLRGVLLSVPMHLETEALLMFAARREHLDKVIEPALAEGTWVVSDRFTDASYAYQGGGRGLSLDRLNALENWVQGSFQPDLTLLFDLPVTTAKARLGSQAKLDRFELEGDDFFERVRASYLVRARAMPERMRLIDSTRAIDNIRVLLEKYITSIC